jgi:hypothetical protein
MSNLFVKFNNANASIPNNFDNNSINQNNTIYPYALGAGCDGYPIRVSIPSSGLVGASGIAFRIGGVGGGCCLGESGPLYSNIVKIPILGNTFAPFNDRTSVLLNGTAITFQYTGDVDITGGMESSVCDGLLLAGQVVLGISNPFIYTMNFNQNIQTLRLRLSGGGAVGAVGTENFTFTSNNGTPSITSIKSCDSVISGNTVLISNGGAGTFEISTGVGNSFSQLTISGNGGLGGTILVLTSLTVGGS